ncbi:OmpA family protein [Gordonia amicalis]|uniref:OmpA family protein n=1 Tax=Gordonia amicalis TaxID=89053 RepID=UPI003A8104D5
MVIVADTHANAPAPTLNEQAAGVVKDAMATGGRVTLIQVSGYPALTDLHLRDVQGTSAGKEAAMASNLTRIERALQKGTATDGADDFEAISRAADTLRDAKADRPAIVFTGSGLSDRGRLDFTAPGILTASPEDVSTYLKRSNALPDLRGITIYLSGIGYAAGPQEPLDAAQRANVTAIWRAVLQASGAEVIQSPDARTGPPVETSATVQTVDVPTVATPAMCSTSEIVFGQQSAVSFIAEENRFVDAHVAGNALSPIASWLAGDRSRTAVIRGTTADDRGDPERLKELGQSRADTVASYLIAHGADRAQISTIGVGAGFPEYVRPDIDPTTGLLLPGPAAMNRSVRIALTDPC